jgi:hypothetical protein
VRTGGEFFLLSDLGNQLRLYLQMAPIAGSILHLDNRLSPALGGPPLVSRVEIVIEIGNQVLAHRLLGSDSLGKSGMRLLHVFLLLRKFLPSFSHVLFLRLMCLSLLLGHLHQVQDLILKRCNMLFTRVDLGQYSAVFLVRLDVAQLALRLCELGLQAVQLAFEGTSLPLSIFDRSVQSSKFFTGCCTGLLIRLQYLRQVVLLSPQSPQPIVQMLQFYEETKLTTHAVLPSKVLATCIRPTQQQTPSAPETVCINTDKWAHLVSNQGPTGYEPVALPTELWARHA